jgi:hypothetical protein
MSELRFAKHTPLTRGLDLTVGYPAGFVVQVVPVLGLDESRPESGASSSVGWPGAAGPSRRGTGHQTGPHFVRHEAAVRTWGTHRTIRLESHGPASAGPDRPPRSSGGKGRPVCTWTGGSTEAGRQTGPFHTVGSRVGRRDTACRALQVHGFQRHPEVLATY